MNGTWRQLLAGFGLLVSVSSGLAGDDAAGIEFFEKKIRPVLLADCMQCHSPEHEVKGGLRLDWRGGWIEGGDSGTAIVPGNPNESLLIEAIRQTDPDFTMPPKKKLTAAQIADFEQWVAIGAPDPRYSSDPTEEEAQRDLKASRQYWAFLPLEAPPIPDVDRSEWPHGELDRFVLARLEESGLAPVRDADSPTLLRRLYFDLIGLPPTPEQMAAFADSMAVHGPKAVETEVDALLASPHFGERWGRHWLDIARFSESTGGGRTLLMTEAWRYRDYVIHAFNADKPYDEFIREQIAGDLLDHGSDLETVREHLIATAFLLLGPTNYELQDKTILEMDIIDEQLDTMGKAFLGMTIGCARCHDHKFDPVSTEDYYGMAGILKGTKSVVHANVSAWNKRPLPMDPEKEAVAKRQAKEIAEVRGRVNALKKQLDQTADKFPPVTASSLPGIVVDNNEARLVGSWSKSDGVKNHVGSEYLYTAGNDGGRKAIYPVDVPKGGAYEVRISFAHHPNRSSKTLVTVRHNDGETAKRVDQKKAPDVDGYFASLGVYEFQPGATEVVEISNDGADGNVVADAVQLLPEEIASDAALAIAATPAVELADDERATLAKALKALEAELKALEKAALKAPEVIAADELETTEDIPVAVRGNVHSPGPVVPRGFIQVLHPGDTPEIPTDESGRRQLAEWLASPDNPLTARVFVNRVWHHLFGRGIVPSVDNFGRTGRLPTHPELLDYLATQFIDQGWSTKQLIREVVLSRVYQLSSNPGPGVQESKDPDNELFWRQNRRRLEAEVIRDAVLAVSGELDARLGGSTIKEGTTIEYGYDFDDTRRSVYTPVFRNTPLEILAVFDFADPNLVVGARTASSVPTQALFLMNNDFVREQARIAAARILSQTLPTDGDRIEYAYQLTLGRTPTPQERTILVSYLEEHAELDSAWSEIMHGLYASLEFRYVN